MNKHEIEYRNAESEISSSSDEGLKVKGYAVVFNVPTLLYESDGIKYYEQVDKNALTNADMKNVVFRYNHNDDFQVLARTSNNTLTLNVDGKGLYIEADLAPTTAGKDIYELIKRKDVNKLSYAYVVETEHYEKKSNNEYVRIIDSIKKLVDVSAVDFPAYHQTNLDVVKRSFENVVNEVEQKRKQIELKSKL